MTLWQGWSRLFGWPPTPPSFPSGPIKPWEEKSDTALLQVIAGALVDPDTGLPRQLPTSGAAAGGDASAANQVTEIARLTSILAKTSLGSDFDIPAHDSLVIARVGSTNNIATMIFKMGVTTVATLTFAYAGGVPSADDAMLLSITQS